MTNLTRRLVFTFIFLTAIVTSCRRSPTYWNSAIDAPLAHSELTFQNIIPDSLIETDSLGLLHLVLDQDLFSFGLDSLLQIPDTEIVQQYASPFFGSVSIGPNTPLLVSPQNIHFDAGGAQIVEATIDSGYIEVSASSGVHSPLQIAFQIPEAKLNGNSVNVSSIIPAADNNGPGTLQQTLELHGYHVNFTGSNHDQVNTLATKLVLSTPNNGTNATISQGDSVSIHIKFVHLVPSYARGYLGMANYSSSSETDGLNYNHNLVSGDLHPTEAKIDLDIYNGFGVDGRIELNQLKGINYSNQDSINLNSAVIGSTININRAIDLNGSFQESDYHVEINQDNSNVIDFLDLLPEKIYYNANGEINPLGNVSNNFDFAYENSKIRAHIRADLPLKVRINSIVLSDTVPFTVDQQFSASTNQATLYLHYDNSYNIEFTPHITVMGSNFEPLESLSFSGTIPPAAVDSNGVTISPAIGTLKKVLQKAELLDMLYAQHSAINFNSQSDSLNNGVTIIRQDQKLQIAFGFSANYDFTIR